MKKLSAVLSAMILCALMCMPVFADMGGPEFIGYEAKTKVETDYFDTEWDDDTNESRYIKVGTIPAHTKLEISNEYDVNGVMYGYFFNAPALNGASGYVRVSDLYVEGRETYPAVKAFKLDRSVRLRVMEPSGIKLYAGPSGSYTEIGTVPKGAEVNVDTLNQNGFDVGSWIYLTYNGMSGWTYCWLYDGKDCQMAELLPEGETGSLWVVRDNAFITDKDGNKLVKVPKGEKLTFDSFNRMPYDIYYYVTYQGKSGLFSIDLDGGDNVVASTHTYQSKNDPTLEKDSTAKVYSYPDEGDPIGTVVYKSGENFKRDYMYYAYSEDSEFRGGEPWAHINKDSLDGWVKITDIKTAPEEYSEYDSGIPDLFSCENSREIEVTAYPKAVETTTAKLDTTEQTEVTEQTEASESTSANEASSDMSAPEESAAAEVTETAPGNSGRQLSPVAIIGICVAAAVVLTLTAFVTLRLIKKKY
ncbi:MAG: SH3 domain-containing protein [Clostridiales bacterium]|nr:SH3 domain-containing protein [Clostridiales bacterium]